MKICSLICGLKYEQALRHLAEGDASSIKYDPASDSFSIEPHYREGDYMIAGDHSYYIKIIDGRIMRQYFDDECMYFSPGEVSKYVHVRDGHRVEPLKKHPLYKYIYKHIAGEPFMVKIDDMWRNSITLKNEELTFGVDIECKDVGVKFGDVVISHGKAWIVTNARTLFLQFGVGHRVPPDQLVMYKTDPTNPSYGISWPANLSCVT